MTPHRIRLREPWQVEALPDCVVHRRRFGAPRTVDDSERVWLTCEGVEGPVRVLLDGRLLGEFADGRGGFAFDVTRKLSPRNELTLEVLVPAPAGERRGEVALEIRRG